MNKKVSGLARDFGWPIHKQGYEEVGAEYIEIPCKTESEIMEATADADAAFAPAEQFSRRVIEHMRSCRIISIAGTGYDHVDLDAATVNMVSVFPTLLNTAQRRSRTKLWLFSLLVLERL